VVSPPCEAGDASFCQGQQCYHPYCSMARFMWSRSDRYSRFMARRIAETDLPSTCQRRRLPRCSATMGKFLYLFALHHTLTVASVISSMRSAASPAVYHFLGLIRLGKCTYLYDPIECRGYPPIHMIQYRYMLRTVKSYDSGPNDAAPLASRSAPFPAEQRPGRVRRGPRRQR
jgi:hypothetical protein